MDKGKYYFDLGSECYDSHKYEQAVNWYKKAIQEGYNDPLMYKDLGRALFKIGNYKEAIEYMKKNLATNGYKRALRMGYKDPFLYNNLGHSLLKLKRFKEAIAYLQQAQKEGYNDPVIKKIISKAKEGLDNDSSSNDKNDK